MAAALLVLAVATSAFAHDLFLKPTRYFVAENAELLIRVLNGTFSKSENAIARPRVREITVVAPLGRRVLDTTVWGAKGDTSTLTVRTGPTGTYIVGASTYPSIIALKAKDFNAYLREDGIPDVLEARRRAGELERPSRERYSKHVKTLIQVGNKRTANFTEPLGYPAEIVPLDNPYALKVGDTLRVRALVDGAPVANQYVLFGGRAADGSRLDARNARTDATGMARLRLRQAGVWYVKFIRMTRMQRDTVDYESKWATLTFELR